MSLRVFVDSDSFCENAKCGVIHMYCVPERVVLWIYFQVTPNLYGTLVANTAAGIAGGTGVMPGGSLSSFGFSVSAMIVAE